MTQGGLLKKFSFSFYAFLLSPFFIALLISLIILFFIPSFDKYQLELIEKDDIRHYNVNTYYHSYDVEIIDAEAKYRLNRGVDELDDIRKIASPMPGKVVKIPVKVGDELKAGDTVIVVSAMKMESEYKVQKDRIVKEVLVKVGDTIDGDQTLVVVE